MTQKLDLALDATAAAAAITVPFWLQALEQWGRALVILGGIVLLGLRIVGAWRALKANRHG